MRKENDITKIMIIGLLIVLAIAVFPIKQTMENAQTTMGNDKTIIVSGSAEETVMPDIAKAYLRIETVKDTADESQSENAEISKAVRNAIEEIVDKENIETNQYYINEKYEWNEELRKSEVIGFVTVHVLEVELDDIEKIGELLDVAVDSGVTNVDSINFQLSDAREKELREKLLSVAAKEAKSKAESLSGALGVDLVGVKSVSESNFYANPYIYRSYAMAESADSMGAKTPTEISPQKIDVTASVSVTYQID